jgi:hypothetical protein
MLVMRKRTHAYAKTAERFGLFDEIVMCNVSRTDSNTIVKRICMYVKDKHDNLYAINGNEMSLLPIWNMH